MLPKHVAIIMDGNGRWAKKNGLSRNEGHKVGSEKLQNIIEYAQQKGIQYITVYAFSTENWNRPKAEVDGLMRLMQNYLDKHLERVKTENFKFKVIGERTKLGTKLIKKIAELEEITANKTGTYVTIAINYGSRDEIIRACRAMIADTSEKINLEKVITEENLCQYLDTREVPDPDLIIRTSGEVRLSNFLMWQAAYSEFYFTDCLWPDFDEAQFDKALLDYQNRKRRFGKSE
ncbi:MAG: di-trans,poly-cis-decaprenylcistransferase [Epulopiscium sp. Nele67-Bin005]|nr:MAG: di-trans,poly-cis-decaprenylcistransferase [Epulopiscium sp. Nele67-Bin005]